MKLNVDQILDLHHTWDFTVIVGGVEYATVRPSVGELASLPRADDPESPSKLLTLIKSFFADPAPDVGKWTAGQMTAFINGYVAYFRKRVDAEKKLDAIAAEAIAKVEGRQANA